MGTHHFRAHQRFQVKLPVTVTAGRRQVASKGTMLNLGIGGGACELDTPLRLGESVEVVLEGHDPLTLIGEVAWVGWAESSAVRLGVRFKDEDAEQIAGLLDLLGLSADVGT